MMNKFAFLIFNLILSVSAQAQFFPIATGAVPFGDSRRNLRADSTNFLWDNTNKQVTLGAGTAANPAHSFVSPNTGNGMYLPGLNTLGFATSGAARLNISSTGVVNVPGLTASTLVQTDASKNLVSSNAVPGTATNDSAASGIVGEFVSQTGTATNVGSTAIISVATATLSPGDWDVTGTVNFQGGVTAAVTSLTASLSLSNSAYDVTNAGNITQLFGTWGAVSQWVPAGVRRVSVAVTTPVFLLGQFGGVTGTGTSITNQSFIRARRVR